MSRRRWVTVAAGFSTAAVICFAGSCKRTTPAEKEKMARLAGTWEWRQAGVTKPTVIVLELTAKGKYTQTTYQEIGGQRKLLYFNTFKKDIRPEPDDPKQIEALKKDGFEPSVDSGRYLLTLGEQENTIAFESDTLTRAETTEGIGVNEQVLRQPKDDEIVIQGKTYSRMPPPSSP